MFLLRSTLGKRNFVTFEDQKITLGKFMAYISWNWIELSAPSCRAESCRKPCIFLFADHYIQTMSECLLFLVPDSSLGYLVYQTNRWFSKSDTDWSHTHQKDLITKHGLSDIQLCRQLGIQAVLPKHQQLTLILTKVMVNIMYFEREKQLNLIKLNHHQGRIPMFQCYRLEHLIRSNITPSSTLINRATWAASNLQERNN